MPVSKPFVIATEGQTIDGRNISREQIQQMAANYDPKVYTAVANLEHLLSYLPESTFSSYGKVVSLSTQETTILGDKKLQLMAVVDVNDAIVGMQKENKKSFASIEIVPNFLSKGIAYLSGLAFTDTPASVGTESMKFSASKQNVYSFKDEIEVVFEPEIVQDKAGEGLFSKVMNLLNGKDKNYEARFTDVSKAVEAVATSQKDLLEKFNTASTELSAAAEKLKSITASIEVDRTAFAALKTEVEKLAAQPNGQPRRTTATGGSTTEKTDC